MSIFSRRNALLGWAVWEGAKIAARFKAAKEAAARESEEPRPKRRKWKALVAGIAAGAGAFVFWRSRSSGPPDVDEP